MKKAAFVIIYLLSMFEFFHMPFLNAYLVFKYSVVLIGWLLFFGRFFYGNFRAPKLILYSFLVTLYFVTIPALVATVSYHQPLTNGIWFQVRYMAIIFSMLVTYSKLKCETVLNYYRLSLFVGCILTFCLVGMALVFKDMFSHSFIYDTYRGYRFMIELTCMGDLAVYLSVRAKNKPAYFLLLVMVYCLLIILKYSRLLLLCYVVITLLIILPNRRATKSLAAVCLIALLVLFSKGLIKIDAKDSSASVKLVQSSIIISELKRRPQRIVLGFGAIDNETRLSTYGYFYPEDTGILGAFFTYGVVGIGVFYLYFREVRLRRKQSLCHKDKTSLETFESLVYTLGVRVMHAFISGGFIFYPANTFLLLSIILKCVGSRDLNEESD